MKTMSSPLFSSPPVYGTSCSSSSSSALSTIRVMRQQERTGYRTTSVSWDLLQNDGSSCKRIQMAAWLHQIADFCHIQRETMEIAMSYTDRYLMKATCSNNTTASSFLAKANTTKDWSLFLQLLTLTSLYTAVKVHEREIFDLASLCNISHGIFTVTQIETMERELLSTLQWRLNPPTVSAFCREYLHLLPVDIIPTHESREEMQEMCNYQAEQMVEVEIIPSIEKSTIAYLALANALKVKGYSHDRIIYSCQQVAAAIYNGDAMDDANINMDDLRFLQQHLYEAIIQNFISPQSENQNKYKSNIIIMTETISQQQQEERAERINYHYHHVSP